MKTCPQCQTSYTDDTLQFCLQDGTPLTAAANASQSGNWGESETLVSPRQHDRIQFDLPPKQTHSNTAGGATGSGFNREMNYTAVSEPPRKSRTGLIVALTVLLTLIVVGAVGFGAFLFYRQKEKNVAVNVNTKPPANTATPNVAENSNVNLINSNANQNTNAATPTPKPTLNPKQIDEIKSDVEDVVDEWKDALENHDLEAHLSNYAPTVDYYKSGNANIGKIRADKQRAFDAYEDIDISIDNLKVTPDNAGEKATAVFDKEWKFESEEKVSKGKVQQQLQLIKINGKWRITGEKDLKVYYLENKNKD